jgi:act minimal PKS acyl carrier protein
VAIAKPADRRSYNEEGEGPMTKFSLDDLREIMKLGVGVDEEVDLDGDIADTEFADLGYDSLAVLELTGQVQRRFPVNFTDDAVLGFVTPAQAVAFVNRQLTEVEH